jgi:F/Y-rich N-terminus/F/Y rich C-terminus/CW-type Zinc Finger/Histone-lysine N-methyltransferase NSD-like, variant PHD zinc finger/PHD-finger
MDGHMFGGSTTDSTMQSDSTLSDDMTFYSDMDTAMLSSKTGSKATSVGSLSSSPAISPPILSTQTFKSNAFDAPAKATFVKPKHEPASTTDAQVPISQKVPPILAPSPSNTTGTSSVRPTSTISLDVEYAGREVESLSDTHTTAVHTSGRTTTLQIPHGTATVRTIPSSRENPLHVNAAPHQQHELELAINLPDSSVYRMTITGLRVEPAAVFEDDYKALEPSLLVPTTFNSVSRVHTKPHFRLDDFIHVSAASGKTKSYKSSSPRGSNSQSNSVLAQNAFNPRTPTSVASAAAYAPRGGSAAFGGLLQQSSSAVTQYDYDPTLDAVWVECDKCSKWRCLPVGTDPNSLPEQWFCKMNPDKKVAGCRKPNPPAIEAALRAMDESAAVVSDSGKQSRHRSGHGAVSEFGSDSDIGRGRNSNSNSNSRRGKSKGRSGKSSQSRSGPPKPTNSAAKANIIGGSKQQYCDDFCAVCLSGDVDTPLVRCSGICRRTFHVGCANFDYGEPDTSGSVKYYCQNCRGNQFMCFLCGEYGENGVDVTKCVYLCGNFFHPECTSQWFQGYDCVADNVRRACPAHWCDHCMQSGCGKLLVKCMLCPVSYHYAMRCRPKGLKMITKKFFICPRHQVKQSSVGPMSMAAISDAALQTDEFRHMLSSRKRRDQSRTAASKTTSSKKSTTVSGGTLSRKRRRTERSDDSSSLKRLPSRSRRRTNGASSDHQFDEDASVQSKSRASSVDIGNNDDEEEEEEDNDEEDDDEEEEENQDSGDDSKDTRSASDSSLSVIHELDETSDVQSQLPLQVSKNLTVHAIGEIESDIPAFHSERYIFPVGYKSARSYASLINGGERCMYISEIIRGDDRPLFRVSCVDSPERYFESESPSGAWTELIRSIAEAEARRAGHEKSTRQCNVSGPAQFGLTSDVVRQMIERLPGASKCTQYVSTVPSKKRRKR